MAGGSVRLRLREVVLRGREGMEPVDLALLASSTLVLLGDRRSVAPDLVGVIGGVDSPASGRVLVGREMVPVGSRRGRELTAYVPLGGGRQGGSDMTVSGYLSLGAAAAGLGRRESREVTAQMLEWCSLRGIADERLGDLGSDDLYRVRFAASCMALPRVMVLEGPVPFDVHPLVSDLCESGCTVVVSAPGVEYIPSSTERVALCTGEGIETVVGYRELVQATAGLVRVRVGFFPSLSRSVLDRLPGATNLLAEEGGFSFHHRSIAAAVTDLVNIARANSRSLVRLEVLPPSPPELAEQFRRSAEPEEGELFCPEDLDT